MIQLVFLVEERSMQEVLNIILPQILPQEIYFQVIPHEGKSDLQKSIPRKLKAWQNPNVFFIILHDQDSNNCIQLKQALQSLCVEAEKPSSLVRIICHELEAWFLGDLIAVDQAFPGKNLSRKQNSNKYRNQDQLNNAAQELKSLVKEYQKISGARKIAPYLDLERNCSISFKVFIEGVTRLVKNAG